MQRIITKLWVTEVKRISGEAYDLIKQTRAHYVLEPTQGHLHSLDVTKFALLCRETFPDRLRIH